MDEKFDKAEPLGDGDLTLKLNNLKGFSYDSREQSLVIEVSNLTNYCAALRITLPMLFVPAVVFLILALTRTVMWSVLFLVLVILGFTFIAATFALLFNKQRSWYVVSNSSVLRSVTGFTRSTDYDNIRKIVPRRSFLLKNGGSIHFKLYKGSGINLQFYLLDGLKETYGLIDCFWRANNAKKDLNKKFEELFPNDRFADLLRFVNHDSAQIDKLPDCLKVYYILWTLYDDMSESGFDEFFINSTEIMDKQLLQACRLFSLPELTDICKRAIAIKEKYDLLNNYDDLSEECSEELWQLVDEFSELDSLYDFESEMKKFYVDHYEKFDFGHYSE